MPRLGRSAVELRRQPESRQLGRVVVALLPVTPLISPGDLDVLVVVFDADLFSLLLLEELAEEAQDIGALARFQHAASYRALDVATAALECDSEASPR